MVDFSQTSDEEASRSYAKSVCVCPRSAVLTFNADTQTDQASVGPEKELSFLSSLRLRVKLPAKARETRALRGFRYEPRTELLDRARAPLLEPEDVGIVGGRNVQLEIPPAFNWRAGARIAPAPELRMPVGKVD
jgi:hypothetical protein